MADSPAPKHSYDLAFVVNAMRRGFSGKCPKCGNGALLAGYLKPNSSCGNCGEETGEISTADIAPYFTIMIVGHIVIPLLLASERMVSPPFWLQVAFWPTLGLALTLWFLPRVKGSVMGLMWALGMRGHEQH